MEIERYCSGEIILESLDDDERWQAAAIALESILGEEVYMEKISDFELVDHIEPRFAQDQNQSNNSEMRFLEPEI